MVKKTKQTEQVSMVETKGKSGSIPKTVALGTYSTFIHNGVGS